MGFEQVKPEDFSTFVPGSVATYIQIEQTLSDVGGGGKEGATFKRKALQAAGWKYDQLTGYTKDPELAADAFNRISIILDKTVVLNEVLDGLKAAK